MNTPVQLIFRGEVLSGFQQADVRRSVGHKLKLDDARLAHLFSGRRVVMKQAVDGDTARRHVAQFAVLGARLHIEAAPDAATPVAGGAARASAATSAQLAQPATMLMPRRPPELSLVPTPDEVAADDDSITCPQCGEQQPKAVFCRSCVTNMPMGIAAKLEDEAAARAEKEAQRQALREARLAGRSGRPAPPGPADAAPFWGLGLKGRMARRPYAAAGAGVSTLLALTTMFVLQRPTTGRFVLAGLMLLAVLVISVRWTVLRCHDVNRSGWWSLLLLVPYLGPIAGIAVSLLPGNAEANDHGEPPAQGSWLPVIASSAMLAIVLSIGGRGALNSYDRERDRPAGGADTGSSSAADHALSDAAAAAFDGAYVPALGHKAFARSSGGGWGWKGNAATAADAIAGAIAACEATRQSYAAACEAIDLDGQSLE